MCPSSCPPTAPPPSPPAPATVPLHERAVPASAQPQPLLDADTIADEPTMHSEAAAHDARAPAQDQPPRALDAATSARWVAVEAQQAIVARLAQGGFAELVTQLRSELLSLRLGPLLERDRIDPLLDHALSTEQARGLAEPLARRSGQLVLAQLQQVSAPVDELIGPSARQHVDELIALPELLPAGLLEGIAHDPAVEAVMQEVLLDALKQFSHRANPFTAEWGLPALLRHLPPIGFGALKAAFEARRTEFEERLEPEIRKFVQGFARKAVDRAVELSARKQGEPELVALRKRIARAILRHPARELAWKPEDVRGALLVEIAASALGHLLVGGIVRARLDALLAELRSTAGHLTVGRALAAWQLELPAPRAWADAAWPVVEPLLAGEAARRLLEQALVGPLAALDLAAATTNRGGPPGPR